MPTEKIPREYSNVVFERIIGTLLRRIENLESIKTVTKIGSLTSDAAPLLAIGESGYTRDDNNNFSLVIKADDGKLYRLSGQVATTTSVVSTPAGVFVLKSGDTMTGLLVLSADPSAALGAATKQYADTKIAESTLTTKGDLIVRDASDVNRLAVGSASQILIPDSPSTVGLKWGNLVFNNDVLIGNNDEIVTV